MLPLFFWHHHSIAFVAPIATITFEAGGDRDFDLIVGSRDLEFQVDRGFDFTTKRDLDFMTDRALDFETKRKV